ncbi:MAG: clan AA aspartic protease [Bacteroidetes bacterium]|jgi:hypothetical protein|nr:clan AA aspartic protease [Bacteroidota bacterium]
MKKEFCFIFFLFLTCGALVAQASFNLNQGYVETNNYFQTVSYENRNGKIIIEVQIEDKPYRFLVDTGAVTVLSETLQKTVTTHHLGSIKTTDQSGLTDSLNVVFIPEIKIENIKFKDIRSLVAKDNSALFFDCLEIDGILGSNMLKNTIIQFRSGEKKIVFTDKSKKLGLKRRHGFKMKVSQGQRSPYLPVRLLNNTQEGNEYVMFDSGDNKFYAPAQHIVEQFQSQATIYEILAESSGSFSIGFFGTAENNEHSLVKVAELTLGNITFEDVISPTIYDDNSRLGAALLNYGILTLDFEKERFWFESFDTKTTIEYKESVWPIHPVLNNQNELVVGIIWDRSLDDDLTIGDKILKFGNIDYEAMSHCEIMNSTLKVETDEALLIYQDQNSGEIKELLLRQM